MILGFNKQFVDKILSGSKIHTVRSDVHDRWKAGRIIQFATGVRTKNYRQFYEGMCVSTQKITIEHHVHAIGDTVIVVDDRTITYTEMQTLAINDGFDSLVDFVKWFDKDCFVGKLINWTEKKY